jgi:hypothetical protein
MTMWLAGGGCNAGHTIGATDETGMTAIDDLNQNRRYNDPGVFCEATFNTYFPIFE